MKKYVIILVGFLIYPTLVVCQIDPIDYINFLKYFPELRTGDYYVSGNKEIPKELVKSVIGQSYREYLAGYAACSILNRSENTTLILEAIEPAGGHFANYYMITFSPRLTLINSDIIGTTILEYAKGTLCSFQVFSDSLLQVKSIEMIIGEDEKRQVIQEEYNFYIVNDTGFSSYILPNVSEDRKYPVSSQCILSEEVLKDLSKEQLDIMRNEIFAEHGYIFNTEKWKRYFEAHSWYYPRYENVSNRLSLVERINIESILKVDLPH